MITRRALAAALLATPALAQPSSTLEKIRRSGVLRVGAVNAQPPYSYTADGTWSGFLIDCATDLAATLGVRVQPVESTWGNGVTDIQTDKVDIFFGLAPTPQRALAVDFTHPLFDNAFALIARPGFTAKTWADLDRPDVRIAIELGTVYDQNIARLAPNAAVTRLRSNNDAFLAVSSGRADCQILVVILALTSLAKNPSLGHLIVPEPVFASPTAAITARSATPDWRNHVDQWIDSRRQSGWIRARLVENLEKIGAKGSDIPPQLLF